MEKRLELSPEKAKYLAEAFAFREKIEASIHGAVGFACAGEIEFTPQTQYRLDGSAIVVIVPDES